MPAIPLGVGAYRRDTGHYPTVRLLNTFLEKDPTNAIDGLSRLQRAGTAPFATMATTPNRAVFQQAGTFNGDNIIVSGTVAYRVTAAGVATSLGTVAGTDLVRIAAATTRAIMVANGTAYSTDGTTVATVTMPDARQVVDVAVLNGFFVLVCADSQRFYWIAPGDTNPDALDFASAESSPDNLVGVGATSDELWFFGVTSTEVWYASGDIDAPFQRIQGRLYNKGAANRDTIVRAGDTLHWAGSDGVVYAGAGSPTRISENGIEERLRQTGRTGLRAWTYALDGHTFFVLRVGDAATFAFDLTMGVASEFQSFNRAYWRAHLGAQTDMTSVICGDSETGELWKLDPARGNDDGETMVREVTGMIAVAGRPQRCDSVSLQASVGWPSAAVENPVVLMRWSDDAGATWDYWRQIKLGEIGQYGREIVLRKLGMMRAPGRLMEFRMTDDCVFRISFARVNEAFS